MCPTRDKKVNDTTSRIELRHNHIRLHSTIAATVSTTWNALSLN